MDDKHRTTISGSRCRRRRRRAFIGKIESMSGKWDAVAHQHIVERVLLALCDEMTKLIDHPDIAEHSMGTAMMKLSNALADYRDSRWEDR